MPEQTNWVAISEITNAPDPDQRASYFDLGSARKTAHGWKAWVMTSYKQPQDRGFGIYQSLIGLSEYDCVGKRSRYLNGIFYLDSFAGGVAMAIMTKGFDWSSPSPEGMADFELKAVCKAPIK
jgi:hypothetical protein